VTDLVVHPAKKPLVGIVPAASDKSIVHRAILFGALATGTSRITKARIGDDHRSTVGILRAMGVPIVVDEVEGTITLEGRGLDGLAPPATPLDCGNSGTTMRLAAGLLAAQPFASTLVGDASLTRRPMARIATPLRLRGARIEGVLDPKKVGEITPPLVVGPLPRPNVLSAIAYDAPIASAQVKGALLLSGLYSDGKTVVSEPSISRDHTERMLSALGVPIRGIGAVVELDGAAFSGSLPAFELEAPGDLSAAAFLVASALLVPESHVGVRGLSVNPTRTGFVELTRLMGAEVAIEPKGEALGEPIGELHARSGSLRGFDMGGELVTRAIDEIPILAVVAARAKGTTRILDAAELRVKESDRIATTVAMLRAFGVPAEERPDGLVVEGRPDGALRASTIDSAGDHRIAMAATVLSLVADGPCRVRDVDCIRTSFPRFVGTMKALGARIEVG
jgi:3-phosphoshikimate 1-carboxyvinyltransferase